MVNINIGVLGHVDSGKTSLCRALSEKASTAAFDKNPQSQERRITIDLGFSTFSHRDLQFTLVDCPGHASLIRTVIGGAQIIDVMLLVIDVTKGVQTQTAECLIIGEICCDRLLVVLNKIDLLEGGLTALEKVKNKLKKTLDSTKFKDAEMIGVSANPSDDSGPQGITELKDLIAGTVPLPHRSPEGPFVFYVDHCFQIKGQGTILTGTVSQGKISVQSTIEFCLLKVQRKVKSIQVFGQPVTTAVQGDRVGICVTQFDAKQFERGVVSTPNHFQVTYAVIMPVSRIAYFRNDIRSGAKFHITSIHDTVLVKQTFFSGPETFSFDHEFTYEDELHKELGKNFFALLEFNQPIICGVQSLILASKLDIDVNTKCCRLAFYGKVVEIFTTPEYKKQLSSLRVFKNKSRTGIVDRVPNETEVIVKSLFQKETNIDIFTGMKVCFSTGETGRIEGSFGQSGKVKIQLDYNQKLSARLELLSKVKKGEKLEGEPINVTLNFKRFVFDQKKRAIQ